MKHNRVLILGSLTMLVLTGCVTEQTGRVQAKPNTNEAANLNVQMGSQYLRQGDWQASRVKLEKAIDQDPGNIVAHRLLGFVYENLDDLEGAERHYRRAVTLAPRDPQALDGLAAFLCRNNRGLDEAQKLYQRALAVPISTQFSDKSLLYTNAGVCMKRIDLAIAENYLRQALASDPQNAEALLQVADVAYQRGNYLQARAFLQRHIDASPATSPAALWLGVRVETAMDDFGAADNYGTKLRTRFPESVETRLLLEQLRDSG